MISNKKVIEDVELNLEFKKSKKVSLSNRVYLMLQEMLITKKLPPGTLLNRRDIAKQMGVSVAPVLEAFIQLELEGYLVTIPRKGTMVTPFGLEEVYGQIIVREALECQAARLYCGKPVRDNYEQLYEQGEKIDSTLDSAHSNWEIEYKFHESLVTLSACSFLISEFTRINKLGTFYSMYNIYAISGKNRVIDSHKKLLSLLVNDDPDIAEDAIREHLWTSKLMLFDEFKKNGLSVPEMK